MQAFNKFLYKNIVEQTYRQYNIPVYQRNYSWKIFSIFSYIFCRCNNYVFNRKNSSADLSFDDLINARRFSSVIFKSSTGLGDGVIKDYVPRDADDQIEESDRIKEQILEMENEMWNY